MTAALKPSPQHSYRLSAFERRDNDFYPTPSDLLSSLPLGLSRLGLDLPRVASIRAAATARSGAGLRPSEST
jgi:hypothetical protein